MFDHHYLRGDLANNIYRFGMDLTLKKQFIGSAVESLLVGQTH